MTRKGRMPAFIPSMSLWHRRLCIWRCIPKGASLSRHCPLPDCRAGRQCARWSQRSRCTRKDRRRRTLGRPDSPLASRGGVAGSGTKDCCLTSPQAKGVRLLLLHHWPGRAPPPTLIAKTHLDEKLRHRGLTQRSTKEITVPQTAIEPVSASHSPECASCGSHHKSRL